MIDHNLPLSVDLSQDARSTIQSLFPDNTKVFGKINDFLEREPRVGRLAYLNNLLDLDTNVAYSIFSDLRYDLKSFQQSALMGEDLSQEILVAYQREIESQAPLVVEDRFVDYRSQAHRRYKHAQFVTGFLLSQTPLSKMSPDLRKDLGVGSTDADARITTRHYLANCSSSEAYLVQSIADSTSVLLDGLMLGKKEGYNTGLCLATTSTSQGTFYEGAWYTPLKPGHRNSLGRQVIAETLEKGQRALTLPPATVWAFVRDVSLYHSPNERSELLNHARHDALAIKAQI